MNILIDSRCLADGVGGIPHYAKSIIAALARRNPQHRFFLFFSGLKKNQSIVNFDIQKNCSVLRATVPNKLLNMAMRTAQRPQLDSFVRHGTGMNPDIIFMPNINYAAINTRIPLVVTIHDLSFFHYPETFTWRSRLWHSSIGVERLIRRASRIIAVSDHTRHEIVEQYGIDEKKITAIPHGHDDFICGAVPTAREEIGIAEDFFLAPGMGAGRKNLQFLISSWVKACKPNDALRKKRLVITGLQSSLPQAENVLYLGTVSSKMYRSLLASASALIYPSRYEGFGLPILEAFTAGISVIASSCSGISEVGMDAYYPFDPYDEGSLVSALHDVSKPDIAQWLVQAGKKRSLQYSWDTAADRTMALLQEAYESF